MSNQISLMLSLIVLTLFVMFSGEIISYQYSIAKTVAATNEIALYVQENGYDRDVLRRLDITKYIDGFQVTKEEDPVTNITTYTIITDKRHTSLTYIFQCMRIDYQCKMVVCRKENYG